MEPARGQAPLGEINLNATSNSVLMESPQQIDRTLPQNHQHMTAVGAANFAFDNVLASFHH